MFKGICAPLLALLVICPLAGGISTAVTAEPRKWHVADTDECQKYRLSEYQKCYKDCDNTNNGKICYVYQCESHRVVRTSSCVIDDARHINQCSQMGADECR
jgi:hypothetical protein